MCRLLVDFRDKSKQAKDDSNTKLAYPSESAITLAFEASVPFADDHAVGNMFGAVCQDLSRPSLMEAFLELYSDSLTPEGMGVGLDAVLFAPHDETQYQFSNIIERYIDMIGRQSYRAAVSICCRDQRPDIVKRLIDTYGYPLIIEGHLLDHSSCTVSTSILKAVFDVYGQMLTTDIILSGFESACRAGASEIIGVYLDQFDHFSNSRFDAAVVQTCCIKGLNEAVRTSNAKVVDLLLSKCPHLLQFEAGHQSLLPLTGLRDMLDNTNAAPTSAAGEIGRLLRAAYGLRLTIRFVHWTIDSKH